MPEQLLGRIIRSSSNPGDLVIDPFAGSGTTLAVAKKLDRSYLGFELSADYVAHIRKRLASIKNGQALDGSPEPLKSVPSTPQGQASQKAFSPPSNKVITTPFLSHLPSCTERC
jgi:site-specific DNA-methyltransferase (adenine-specific)